MDFIWNYVVIVCFSAVGKSSAMVFEYGWASIGK